MIFGSAAASKFPVTGLVSTQSLVRGEGFVADTAFITEFDSISSIWTRLRYRRRPRRSGLGGAVAVKGGGIGCGDSGRAATSEHDEAESEILFLGARRLVTGALGTLSFSPWLQIVEVGVFKGEGGCGGGR